MITLKQFYLNELRECCYILSDQSGECVIVDPGISSESERMRIVKYITENNLTPVKLLCTHGHFDHVMGNRFIADSYKVKTYIHPLDKDMLGQAQANCRMFGYEIENPPEETIDITDGQEVIFGNSKLKVVCTPGHTPGSVCFVAEDDKFVLTGDTLFAGSCGRTDLPEGDPHAMFNSLINVIVPAFKADWELYCGHGPNTTMEYELAHNLYLKAENWLGYGQDRGYRGK